MNLKKLNELKKEARAKVIQMKKAKESKKYNPDLMKRRWLREFQDPYSRSFRQAEILKEKYYKSDDHITAKVIYGRIWSWSKENSIRDNKRITKWKSCEVVMDEAVSS